MRDSRCTAQDESQRLPLLDHHRRGPRNKLELGNDERPHVLEAQMPTGPELAPDVLHRRRLLDPSPVLQKIAGRKKSQHGRRTSREGEQTLRKKSTCTLRTSSNAAEKLENASCAITSTVRFSTISGRSRKAIFVRTSIGRKQCDVEGELTLEGLLLQHAQTHFVRKDVDALRARRSRPSRMHSTPLVDPLSPRPPWRPPLARLGARD